MVSQLSGLKVFKGFISDCLFCLIGFAMMKIIIKKDKTLEKTKKKEKLGRITRRRGREK